LFFHPSTSLSFSDFKRGRRDDDRVVVWLPPHNYLYVTESGACRLFWAFVVIRTSANEQVRMNEGI
jgi:hypothetical protein